MPDQRDVVLFYKLEIPKILLNLIHYQTHYAPRVIDYGYSKVYYKSVTPGSIVI